MTEIERLEQTKLGEMNRYCSLDIAHFDVFAMNVNVSQLYTYKTDFEPEFAVITRFVHRCERFKSIDSKSLITNANSLKL